MGGWGVGIWGGGGEEEEDPDTINSFYITTDKQMLFT